jgi:hypothetical protein
MIASAIQDSINQAQWILGCLMGMAMLIVVLVFKALKVLGRGLRREYTEAGGNKQLAKNVVVGGARAIVKRAIFKR